LEGHGREEIFTGVDVSRTVGWFTTIYPVYVELEGKSPAEDLKRTKDQLREIPWHGLGYGVLRYLSQEGKKRLAHLPPADILFNYLGQFDQVLQDNGWQHAAEAMGAPRSRLGDRTHILEITSHVVQGCLHTDWHYSRNLHRESTIRQLAADYQTELQILIDHCRSAEPTHTPSDFPLARLSQNQLEQIESRRKRISSAGIE